MPPINGRSFSTVSRHRTDSRPSTHRRRESRTPPSSRTTSNCCFNCGGAGHFARQCPSPSSSGPKPSGTPFRQRSRVSGDPTPSHVRDLSPRHSRFRDDFEDARNQINALSVSLREKQDALDNSNARVAALLKRNDELSRSVFTRASPPSPAPASCFVGVNSLMLCLLACALLPTGLCQPAWFCPQDSHEYPIRIPLTYNCSRLIPDISSPPRNLSVHLYRPNSKRYDTPASLCKIVEQTVTYSVGFFGARYENHSEHHKAVPIEHCRLMAQHNQCEYGALTKVGSVFRTSHPLTIPWPSAPFGCCVTHSLTVTNCFLIPTHIHVRYGASFPDSAVTAFLDVSTFLLSSTADPVPCTTGRSFLIPFSNGTVRFDPLSGSQVPAFSSDIPVLGDPFKVDLMVPSVPLTIFHNLVLTNVSELLPDQQLTELWQTRQYERILSPLDSQSPIQNSQVDYSATPALPSLWNFFPLTPFDIWVAGCCSYVSFLMIKAIIRLYLKLNYPHLLQSQPSAPTQAAIRATGSPETPSPSTGLQFTR
ncbi:zinc knuckle, partial [Ostertagia ostertagi]